MGRREFAVRALLWSCSYIVACRTRNMEVELDAFSGRPNPRWVLTGDEATHLLRELQSLPETKDSPEPPDLGFRGFLLHADDRYIRIFSGRIVVEISGKRTVFKDIHGVEQELARQARERGFGGIIGELR